MGQDRIRVFDPKNERTASKKGSKEKIAWWVDLILEYTKGQVGARNILRSAHGIYDPSTGCVGVNPYMQEWVILCIPPEDIAEVNKALTERIAEEEKKEKEESALIEKKFRERKEEERREELRKKDVAYRIREAYRKALRALCQLRGPGIMKKAAYRKTSIESLCQEMVGSKDPEFEFIIWVLWASDTK